MRSSSSDLAFADKRTVFSTMENLIHFGASPTDIKTGKEKDVTPRLKARGINLVKLTPAFIAVNTISVCVAPAWGILMSLLSALVFSIATREKISCCQTTYNIGNRTHPSGLTYELPPLIVRVIADEQKTTASLLNLDGEVIKIRGLEYVIIENMNMDTLSKISSNPIRKNVLATCFAPYGTVNMQSMASLIQAYTLISCAISCFNVAFFGKTPKDLGAKDIMEMLKAGEIPQPKPAKPEEAQPKLLNTHFGIWRGLEDMFSSIKSAVSGPFTSIQTKSNAFLNLRPCIFSYDSFRNNPDAAGMVFKYEHDLAAHDTLTVPNFIERYLIRNMGSTSLECLNEMQRFRGEWARVATCPAGMALTHIVRSMDFCVAMQLVPCPVYNYQYYEGLVGLGFGAACLIADKVYTSQGGKKFQDTIRLLSSHHYAREEITSYILAGGNIRDDAELDIAFSSMWNLREYFKKESTTIQPEAIGKIVQLAADLRFPDSTWKITVTNIGKFLDLIAGTQEGSDIKIPISSEALFETNLEKVYLSAFGKLCPSFWIPSGTELSLLGEKPPNPVAKIQAHNDAPDSKRKKKRPQAQGWTVHINRVSLDTAYLDLQLFKENRSVRSVPPEISENMGLFKLRGAALGELWPQLRRACKVSTGTTRDKRKRDSDGDPKEGEPKGKKVAGASGEEESMELDF